ncbi:capsid cement protein [Roseiconus lacunae]|uniref:DUF2190 family protein n=1 Tax=Roseiconus lacunae TaxID=2605694 RepID=A0ABT7PEN9_9BACT|nr:capsid cement protein [Roseiconus lacunae]MDM4014968.1 DUF2190 family protein [Roseiconus lacunae]
MTTFQRAPTRTLEASEAISKHLRVKVLAAGTAAIAGAADSDIGTSASYAHDAGDEVAVDIASLEGTERGIAAVAIDIGDKLYGAADGEIGKTNTNAPIGIAMSAAGAGDVVEFVRRQI